MEENVLKRILKGKFSPGELHVYFLLTVALSLSFLFIAWVIYPEKNNYSIMTCTISYLGAWSPHRNPEGWYFLIIAYIFMSTLFVPIYMFIHNRLSLLGRKTAKLVLFFFIAGSISMIVLGFVPDVRDVFAGELRYRKLHKVLTAILVFNFGWAFLLSGWLLLKNTFKRLKEGTKFFPSGAYIITPYIILFVMSATIAITQAYRGRWPGKGIYSFPMWEWIFFTYLLMFIYYLATFVLVHHLPHKQEENLPVEQES